MSPESPYPYLVVRYMACVYRRRPVWFGIGLSQSPEALIVPGPTPADRSRLTPAQRDAVVEAASKACIESGFRHCVVFGRQDAVYVELDGSRSSLDAPPSGGVQI